MGEAPKCKHTPPDICVQSGTRPEDFWRSGHWTEQPACGDRCAQSRAPECLGMRRNARAVQSAVARPRASRRGAQRSTACTCVHPKARSCTLEHTFFDKVASVYILAQACGVWIASSCLRMRLTLLALAAAAPIVPACKKPVGSDCAWFKDCLKPNTERCT